MGRGVETKLHHGKHRPGVRRRCFLDMKRAFQLSLAVHLSGNNRINFAGNHRVPDSRLELTRRIRFLLVESGYHKTVLWWADVPLLDYVRCFTENDTDRTRDLETLHSRHEGQFISEMRISSSASVGKSSTLSVKSAWCPTEPTSLRYWLTDKRSFEDEIPF